VTPAEKQRGDNAKGKPRGKPFEKGNRGRPKGVPNKATQDMKKLAREMTTGNPEWVRRTRQRLEVGKEAPAIARYLLEMGHGKPKETVAVESVVTADISAVLTQLSPRALKELLKVLRENE
jgi:hypothetical protein